MESPDGLHALSPECRDELEREADRTSATRALPGTAIVPAMMVVFTIGFGPDSAFWRPSVALGALGLLLCGPRIWLALRWRRLPDTADPRPWRRAFAAAAIVNLGLFGIYVGLGIRTVGLGVPTSMLLFCAECILASSVHVFAANKRLMETVVLVLFAFPLAGAMLLDTSMKYLLVVLPAMNCAYSLMLGRRLNEEYWQRAVARAQLASRNTDMRLVLDNVGQALMTVDAAGTLALERSAKVDGWFGAYDRPVRFVDYIAAYDPDFAEHFELAHEALLEDILPREVCIAQLPVRLRRGEQHLSCSYVELPNRARGENGLLIVLNDVSEQVRRVREEVQQKEVVAVAQGLMADRAGYLAFHDEGSEIMEQLSQADLDCAIRDRLLHTLKGNAAMVGAEALAAQCHAAEDEIVTDGVITSPTMTALVDRWNAITHTVKTLLGPRTRGMVEVASTAIEALATRALVGEQGAAIAATLAEWTLEPVERSLDRLAHYAVPLAKRLGKGALETCIHPSDARIDPARWNPLWSVLVHVVRNAVDHGIESSEERATSGKPCPASLALGAHVAEGSLIVTIADDGRGIDWQRVKLLAAQRGLPAATHAELVQALLAPAFSTRDDVTTISGRGIGMAAVAQEIDRLGGVIDVVSACGVGTTWRFSLPLTPPMVGRHTSGQRAA